LWHAELLELMSRRGPRRGAVISPDLQRRLRQYLAFRHFFRHAYTFELDWSKMADLVLRCQGTLGDLRGEFETFLAAGRAQEEN